MRYTSAFEQAVDHAMLYEVGGHWKLTPEVEAGLIATRAQRIAVGYVDDPLDRGGETKFGVAKNANPDLNITALTWEEAKSVYYGRYWLAGSCDKIVPRVAVLHFDGCVNHGIKRANRFLQTAVGVSDDGVIGPITLGKVNNADEFEICHSVCLQREKFYRDIVRRNPPQARFLNGWLRRISEMRDFVMNQQREF